MKSTVLDNKVGRPLYLQLSEALAQGLIAHQDDEDKLPSVREIARTYNVSVITATKAADHLKSKGIVYGHQGKGLYVKDRDRLLECYAAQPKTIGVTFLDIYNTSSAFLSTVICSLSAECSRLGFNLQIFSTPSSAGAKDNPLFRKNLRKKNLDGLIIASRMPIEDVRLIQESGIPFVWINVDLPGENIYCAVADRLYAMRMCLLHIKKLGHKKIAILSAEKESNAESYLALCPEYGLEYSYHISEGSEWEAGYRLAKTAIETENPDVIFTRGTALTASALGYITEQRISLPGDLGLIAYTSSSSSPFLPANITVLTDRAAVIAAQSVGILHKILEQEEPIERKTLVPAELVIRGSCGFPIKGHGELAVSELADLNALAYPALCGA